MNRKSGKGLYRIFLLGVMMLTLSASAAFTQSTPDEVLKIMAGNSMVYAVDFKIEKVATGDPKIFGVVQTGDNEMIINAIAEGASNLIIWGPEDVRKEVFINVLTPELMLKAKELSAMLGDIEGVDVKIVGKRIIVEGLLFKSKDYSKINQLLAGMPEVVNLVRMSPFMKKIVAGEIERTIGREGIRVKVAKNAFLLEGVVPNAEESKRAEMIALAYSPNVVNALLSEESQIRPEPYEQPQLIEVNMTIMEVTKSALKEFGIFWNPELQETTTGSFDHESQFDWFPATASMSETLLYSLTGTLTSFFPKMRRIHNEGKGRALMQQTLITKDTSKAEFFAGSEEPIPVAQGNGVISVEYKKVGMTLNVTPHLDPLGNVETLLEMESSTVAGEGASGAPIINSNNMNTAVNVKEGTTIVLGGLAGQRELRALANENPNGEPTLFQANYDNQRSMEGTEVVVFITPRIVREPADAGLQVRAKTKRSFKRVELEHLREAYKDKFE